MLLVKAEVDVVVPVGGIGDPRIFGVVTRGPLTFVLTERKLYGSGSKNASSLFWLCVRWECRCQPWSNVETNSVVQVRIPADGLLMNRLPTYEDVVRIFAREDLFQLRLQVLSSCKPRIRTIDPRRHFALLPRDPVTKGSVNQFFECLAALTAWRSQPMVVNKSVESVVAAIPNVPDEWVVMEDLAMFREETIT